MDKSKRSLFEDDLEYTLAGVRKLNLFGAINGVTAFIITQKLDYFAAKSKKPVNILLCSGGGGVYEGLELHDKIVQLRKTVPVYITASGACMSMGMTLLQSGTKRFATPNTSFLLHELRGSAEGTLGELRDVTKENERIQKILTNILARRCGMSPKDLLKLYERKDYFFGVDDAMKYKFIDAVVGA